MVAGSIVIERRARLEFTSPVRAGNLTVHGQAGGTFECGGEILITKGGLIEGRIAAKSVIVEDGNLLAETPSALGKRGKLMEYGGDAKARFLSSTASHRLLIAAGIQGEETARWHPTEFPPHCPQETADKSKRRSRGFPGLFHLSHANQGPALQEGGERRDKAARIPGLQIAQGGEGLVGFALHGKIFRKPEPGASGQWAAREHREKFLVQGGRFLKFPFGAQRVSQQQIGVGGRG